MINFKKMSFVLPILFSSLAFAQHQVDKKQDERISAIEKNLKRITELEKSVTSLRKKVKSQNKIIDDLKKSGGGHEEHVMTQKQHDEIVDPRLKELDQQIADHEKKLKQLKEAITKGLDPAIVSNSVDTIEKAITSLKAKKHTILTTNVSNQPQRPDEKKEISYEALVEIDAVEAQDFDKKSTSQVELATLELATEVSVNEFVKGNLLLEYNGDDNKIEPTEAFITYGNTEKSPLVFSMGKMTVPFGRFETSLFSDPLGLEYFETAKDVVMFGSENLGFVTSVYTFKGATQKAEQNESIRHFGAQIQYVIEKEEWGIDTSINYINNMSEAGIIAEKGALTTINSEVAGLAGSLVTRWDRFSVVFEYITAMDYFHESDLSWTIDGVTEKLKPSSLQAEFSYSFMMHGYESSVTLGYQSTEHAVFAELPKSRSLLGMNVKTTSYTSVGFEYYQSKDYETTECFGSTCGKGETDHKATVRMTLAF